MLRTLIFLGIGLCIFLFPWWVATILALVCSFYFDMYVELVFFAISIDALYGYAGGVHRFVFTSVAVLVLLLIPLVKSKLHVRS